MVTVVVDARAGMWGSRPAGRTHAHSLCPFCSVHRSLPSRRKRPRARALPPALMTRSHAPKLTTRLQRYSGLLAGPTTKPAAEDGLPAAMVWNMHTKDNY